MTRDVKEKEVYIRVPASRVWNVGGPKETFAVSPGFILASLTLLIPFRIICIWRK